MLTNLTKLLTQHDLKIEDFTQNATSGDELSDARDELSDAQSVWNMRCNNTTTMPISTTITTTTNFWNSICIQLENLINDFLNITTTTLTSTPTTTLTSTPTTTLTSTLTSGLNSTLTTITQAYNSTISPNNNGDESSLFHYIFWPIAAVVAIAASVGLICYCNKDKPRNNIQSTYNKTSENVQYRNV